MFLPSIQHEELMKWYQSGVTRARIRVFEVNFGETLIKVKNILFELAGNSSYRVRVNRVKWGEIQGNRT